MEEINLKIKNFLIFVNTIIQYSHNKNVNNNEVLLTNQNQRIIKNVTNKNKTISFSYSNMYNLNNKKNKNTSINNKNSVSNLYNSFVISWIKDHNIIITNNDNLNQNKFKTKIIN